MENMTLDDYRKLVERVMQDAVAGGNSQARVFSNTGTEHANIVINTMLDYAQSSVATYCRNLDSAVWDASKVRSFIERTQSTKMRVLINDAGSADSALRSLDDIVAAGRLEVRVINEDANDLPHIAVADGRHVRVERDTARRKAVVAFGNDKLGEQVTALFDEMWASGKAPN